MSDFDTFEENASGSLLIDLESVEEQSFDPIPAGLYNVVVEECEFKISKSDKPMWEMRLSVVDGPHENRKLFTYVSFSEKALPMSKAAIKALDASLITSSFDPKGLADSGQLTGLAARVKVGIRKGEGEYSDSNDIKAWMPAGSGSDDGDDFI